MPNYATITNIFELFNLLTQLKGKKQNPKDVIHKAAYFP